MASPFIQVKAGVVFGGFRQGLIRILWALDGLLDELEVPLVITSASDGKHRVTSKHYRFEALDLRTKTMTTEQKYVLVIRLQEILGPDFDVLLEDEGRKNEHLHVEYDPKETSHGS